jgi:hypothetical protein
MLRPLFAPSRIAALAIIFVVTLVLVLSATSLPTSGVGSSKAIHKIKETAQSAANNICNNDSPLFGRPTISDSFRRLYGSILHPISSHTYTDANDKVFEIKEDADAPWWDRPLGKDVLIVDIDTRMPNGTNELWNEAPLNWEKMMDNNGDGGMISASFMNHFLYCKHTHPFQMNRGRILMRSSPNTRLRLPLLQRARIKRPSQHMGEATCAAGTPPLIPICHLHRRRRHHPPSRSPIRMDV